MYRQRSAKGAPISTVALKNTQRIRQTACCAYVSHCGKRIWLSFKNRSLLAHQRKLKESMLLVFQLYKKETSVLQVLTSETLREVDMSRHSSICRFCGVEEA